MLHQHFFAAVTILLAAIQPASPAPAGIVGIDSLPPCPIANAPAHREWKTVITHDHRASFRLPKMSRPVPNNWGGELWGFNHGDVGYTHWPSDARDVPHHTFNCVALWPGGRIMVSYMHGHWGPSLGWHYTAMIRLRNNDMLELSGQIDDPYPPDDMWAILSSLRIRDP